MSDRLLLPPPSREWTTSDFTLGRWLFVALAVVGLAFAAPVVSAHGNETTADDTSPYDGIADDWAARMGAHMTDHMGPGSVEWMESHTGVTDDEMAQDMADDDYYGGVYGQGHC
ncbi:hypothetical protein SAMN04487948_1191 [Halogranum amylolyticum]|uniref:Uncharacterized protein n=1 Tax=Halogranum amylolyticum TaxID=660520 RepID=A0A1H8VR30_9EURY|nr:hypothetical protein [Halogranum amylolyticum]SEP17879.1 hypothetical protein SAMN04487948_1191 [Halogranum amylolyticum]